MAMNPNDMTMLILGAAGIGIVVIIFLRLWPRKRNFIERPVDIHATLLKNRKKAGKRNLRGVNNVRWLCCIGEADYYDMRYGRIIGMFSGTYCDEYFVKTGLLRPAQWIICPKELVRDKHGQNLCIECNGFDPVGNFYIPVYTSDTNYDHVKELNALAFQHEGYLIEREKDIELAEQGAHAMKDALDVRNINTNIRDREDYVQKVPGQPAAGLQYDEKQVA